MYRQMYSRPRWPQTTTVNAKQASRAVAAHELTKYIICVVGGQAAGTCITWRPPPPRRRSSDQRSAIREQQAEEAAASRCIGVTPLLVTSLG
jgi:hypothetical protein